MINYSLKDLFFQDSVHKGLVIEWGYFENGSWVSNGTITNDDLHQENFSLTESLCSENQLRFGCCESSQVKFRVSNIFQTLKDKNIKISIILDGNTDKPFELGAYKVHSDVPTADRSWRDVTAYDSMYDILNKDVTKWYNNYWIDNKEVKLSKFRSDFLDYCGIEQKDVYLANDNMTVSRSAYAEKLTGKDVITAICEINGCFGHINRQGKFSYIYLNTNAGNGLYPSDTLYPSDSIYPSNPPGETIYRSYYKSCKYESFETKPIDKLQIRIDEEDIGSIIPDVEPVEGENVYSITGNFLVYGKTEYELQEILLKIYNRIALISYRPFSAECVGNPCREVGDSIRLATKNQTIVTFVLQRTIKGIQSLKDSISSKGLEKYAESNQNSISTKINALRSTSNKLIRTSEETVSRIEAITLEQEEMASSITQNAEQIELKVSKGNVSSQISVESEQVTIGGNRLVIESENFKLTGSGEVEATGKVSSVSSENKVSSLDNGRVYFYHDGSNELGYMGGYSDAYEDLRVSLTNAGVFSHRIGGSGYYFLNNGGNPGGYTERHYFRETARMQDIIATSIAFDNGQKIQKHTDLGETTNLYTNGGMYVDGSFACSGTKTRAVNTDNYGIVGTNALETAGAYFSDIGSGTISDGVCYVWIESKFAETIDLNHEYQVFLTRTSKETTEYVEKHKDYFIVHGEDGATFDWQIIAKQKDYQNIRLENIDTNIESEIPYDMSVFYNDNTSELVSENYMSSLESNVVEESVCNALDYMETENAILESEV